MVMLVIKSEDNMLTIVQSLVTLLVLYKSAAFLNQFTESRLRVTSLLMVNVFRVHSILNLFWFCDSTSEAFWTMISSEAIVVRFFSCFISGFEAKLKIVELKFIWILIFECNFNWNHWAWYFDWSLLFHA